MLLDCRRELDKGLLDLGGNLTLLFLRRLTVVLAKDLQSVLQAGDCILDVGHLFLEGSLLLGADFRCRGFEGSLVSTTSVANAADNNSSKDFPRYLKLDYRRHNTPFRITISRPSPRFFRFKIFKPRFARLHIQQMTPKFLRFPCWIDDIINAMH